MPDRSSGQQLCCFGSVITGKVKIAMSYHVSVAQRRQMDGTCNLAFGPLYALAIGQTDEVSWLILAFVELWSIGGTGGMSRWTADCTLGID